MLRRRRFMLTMLDAVGSCLGCVSVNVEDTDIPQVSYGYGDGRRLHIKSIMLPRTTNPYKLNILLAGEQGRVDLT
jgi:hypothetical protein